ncbi:MAG: HNH endonuclease [Chloroflexi bacterium]|nr:HNH endonuclease [Chloroflexota bacterium]
MVNSPVLVLNQNYEPLNICRARRAVLLVFNGKAEVLENGRGEVHAISCTLPLPSVIRLSSLVKYPRRQHRRLRRTEVFARDLYTCQYCGKQTRELTVDHVMPRRLAGQHTWENVVSACIQCNRHKAGRTPQQAHMKLLRQPVPPPTTGLFIPSHYLKSYEQWHRFIVPWMGQDAG